MENWEFSMKRNKFLLIFVALLIFLSSTTSSFAVVETNYFLYGPPNPPYGPTEGEINIPYTFCIELPDEIECEPYFISWDFGDGYISEWSGPYVAGEIICELYSWSEPGDYQIRVGIKDGCENEYWTDPLIIHITVNNAPCKPIISGPTNGRIGVEYYWTFLSTDPEGKNITYYIDWGDYCGSSEWNGPHPSGEEVQIGHTYYYVKAFTLSSFAADENGKESDWTGFTVNITKSKTISSILEFFLERLPYAFPIVRFLLKL